MHANALLDASDITVGYRHRRHVTPTLASVSLHVGPGELIALVGGNGAGKSTLLRSLTGIQPPLHGHVNLHGTDVMRLDRRVRAQALALVLAERVEAMGLSVRETVALGRHPYSGWSGRLDDRDERIIDDALEAAAASPLASRRVAELSDGERQRVAIARAIAQEPDVLILDEPTAFLDPRARLNVMSLLRRLTAAKRFAAVVATHDLELVLPHATQVWVAGQATLVTGALTDDHVRAALRTELGADVTTVDGRPHITYEDSL